MGGHWGEGPTVEKMAQCRKSRRSRSVSAPGRFQGSSEMRNCFKSIIEALRMPWEERQPFELRTRRSGVRITPGAPQPHPWLCLATIPSGRQRKNRYPQLRHRTARSSRMRSTTAPAVFRCESLRSSPPHFGQWMISMSSLRKGVGQTLSPVRTFSLFCCAVATCCLIAGSTGNVCSAGIVASPLANSLHRCAK